MYVCLRRRARGEGPGDLAGGGRLRVELDGAAAGHHLLRAALHAVRQIAAAEPGYIYLSMYVCMYVCMYVEKSRSLVDSWHCSEYDCSLFFPLYSIEGITLLV